MISRLLDYLLALVGLLLLAPALAVIAVAVYLTDGSPVFFRQERVGLFGKPFRIWKFRTMRNLPAAERGTFDLGNQSRVTKVGALLRKTKFDELPQLFNVLAGEMAIVGPRPEVAKWVQAYPAEWAKVHQALPGITDPAAIEFRNEEELLRSEPDPEAYYRDIILPRKLRSYQAYLTRKSALTDLGVILKTLLVLLKRS